MSTFEGIRRVRVDVPPRRRCVHCHRFASVYAWRVDHYKMPVRYCDRHAAEIIGAEALVAAAPVPVQASLEFDAP